MANEQNLRPATPFNELSAEEHKRIASKGGKASGKARRKNKLFKEAIEEQLGDSLDNIIKSMIENAEKGSKHHAEFLRDTIGQKPVDNVNQNTTNYDYEEYLKKVSSKDEY